MGLFRKKKIFADSVFFNGRFLTLDRDDPEVSALACKDGLILALGDDESISAFSGPETLEVDLEGEYALPGFILTEAFPAVRAAADFTFFITPDSTEESLLADLTRHIGARPGRPSYFGWGFSPRLLPSPSLEECAVILDKAESEVPVLLISDDGTRLWLNTAATGEVLRNAREDAVPRVNAAYILHVLSPFDPAEMSAAVRALSAGFRNRGVTTLFSNGEPEFLQDVFQQCLVDRYQLGRLFQRFFGAFPVPPKAAAPAVIQQALQKKTNLTELDDCFHYNMLRIRGDAAEDLTALCAAAGDNGFDLFLDAPDPQALFRSAEAVGRMRGAGYRRNTAVLAHGEALEELNQSAENPVDPVSLQITEAPPSPLMEDLLGLLAAARSSRKSDDEDSGGFRETPAFPDPFRAGSFGSTEELIRFHTCDAAERIGAGNLLGTLAPGKYADLAVFGEDPFSGAPEAFSAKPVTMAVLGGAPVFWGDPGEDDDDEENDPPSESESGGNEWYRMKGVFDTESF